MPRKNKKEKEKQLALDLVGLAGVDGLGFAKAAELHVALGVTTVHELYIACREGKVAEVWSEEREKKLKSSIELSVMWFQSNVSKAKKKQQEEVVENMAKAVGISGALMKEIAEAHKSVMNPNDEDT